MHVLLDHLAATLITGTVMLILAVVAIRGEADEVDATSFYVLNKQITSFGEVLRRDLEALSTPISFDTTGGDFEFRARIVPHDTTEYLVRYTRVQAGQREGEVLYRINRTVGGAAAGGSPGLLKTWVVEAQTGTGSVATTASDVSQIYVAFETVTPFYPDVEGAQLTPDTLPWDATIVPTLLHFDSF